MAEMEPASSAQMGARRPIVIIGAGWTGLQAAALLRNKYERDVLVFDLRDGLGGTWATGAGYTGLTSHSPSSTSEFIGFPFPKDLVANRAERVSAAVMNQYIQRFVERAQLQDVIRLNTRVVSVDQVGKRHVKVVVEKDGQRETIDAMFVVNTGFGVIARPVPDYEGKDKFPGPMINSHEFKDDVLERFAEEKRTVLVVGGSKAACDVIKTLVNRGVAVKWLARKTYWYTNYERLVGSRIGGTVHAAGALLYAYAPRLAMSLMRASGAVWNPHPETTSTAFHFGVASKDMIDAARKAEFFLGEVAEVTETGVRTNKGEEITCDALVACFGTDVSPLNPTFLENGEPSSVTESKHLYQFAIHPTMPDMYHAGPIPLKGFGMLNGYHSVQHIIKYLAESPSAAVMEKRRKSEERRLRPLVRGEMGPEMTRSFSMMKNALAYFLQANIFYERNGFARPLHLSLVSFVRKIYINLSCREPTYNHPTLSEVKRAFGEDAHIRKGAGDVPPPPIKRLGGARKGVVVAEANPEDAKSPDERDRAETEEAPQL